MDKKILSNDDYISPEEERAIQEAILKGFLEVTLTREDSFPIIRETLTRIGHDSYSDDPEVKPTLVQLVHLFHKKGRYYIVHYKELYDLDGKLEGQITTRDTGIRNSVALLLQKYGLINILDDKILEKPINDNYYLLHNNEKKDWNLKQRYIIGKNNVRD